VVHLYIDGGDNMSRTAFIRARTEPMLKKKAENIFKNLGLTATDAITLFYKQVILNRGIPFDIKIPNKETLKVFKETDEGKNLTEWKNIDEYFEEMDL
jgi:DNA-damage-inducible protein J